MQRKCNNCNFLATNVTSCIFYFIILPNAFINILLTYQKHYIMIKALKIKTVNSDIESRMKEFEKIRTKLKSDIKKKEAKNKNASKEGKGMLKSISDFFSDSPKNAPKK